MKNLVWLIVAWSGLQSGIALGCSNATLNGTVVTAIAKTNSAGPASTMYMESWDGAGHLQYLESDSTGTTTDGLYYGTGTYTIGANCVATVYYDGDLAQPWTFYIDANGQGYSWVNNLDVGIVAAGQTTLISKELLVDPSSPTLGPCTAATLTGTMSFAFEAIVNGVPAAGAGMESYDGAGHLAYRQTNSDGYTTIAFKGTGTYTITDRCVASVYYDGSTTPWVYFVAPNGSAYWWINNQNDGTVSAGKATRTAKSLVVK